MKKKRFTRRVPKKLDEIPKCHYCTQKTEPAFADTGTLVKFITDRGKIYARTRSGICMKHQKRMALSIKHARHLALLPFISRE